MMRKMIAWGLTVKFKSWGASSCMVCTASSQLFFFVTAYESLTAAHETPEGRGVTRGMEIRTP